MKKKMMNIQDKGEAMASDKIISIRVSEEEFNLIKQQADTVDMKVSSYCRSVLLGEGYPNRQIARISEQLNRIVTLIKNQNIAQMKIQSLIYRESLPGTEEEKDRLETAYYRDLHRAIRNFILAESRKHKDKETE